MKADKCREILTNFMTGWRDLPGREALAELDELENDAQAMTTNIFRIERDLYKDKADKLQSKCDRLEKGIDTVIKEIQEEIQNHPRHPHIGKKGVLRRLQALKETK